MDETGDDTGRVPRAGGLGGGGGDLVGRSEAAWALVVPGDFAADATALASAGTAGTAAGRLGARDDLPASVVRAVLFAVFFGESGFMRCLR